MQTLKQVSKIVLSKTSVTERPLSESKPIVPKYTCDVCRDVGWVRVEQTLTGDVQHYVTERCSCKAAEDAARLQRLSGLTDLERRMRLESIDTRGRPGTAEMVNACKIFLQHPYGMFVVHGTSGNAKTAALQAVVNVLVERNLEATYITAFDLISYIRDAFTESKEIKSESAYDRIVRFGKVPFLAIDELDKIKMTDWVMEQVTDLIDRRYRLGEDTKAGTMIAMNGDPRNLPMWIYSRLSQGVIVQNNDSDLRPYLK